MNIIKRKLSGIFLLSLLTGLIFEQTIQAQKEAKSLGYIEYTKIAPGQGRYSIINVDEKVKTAEKKGYTVKDSSGKYTFKFADGTSIVPEDAAIPVIKAPFGLVLVDGHHDVLASMKLGATHVPVKQVDDLSNLSETEFWKTAEEKNYVYPYGMDGKKITLPRTFDKLVDDPNRYFATVISAKCLSTDTPDNEIIKFHDYPVWAKVGKDIPFIEFKIANVLYEFMDISDDVAYLNRMGSNPPDKLVEKARETLLQHPIKGLKLITTKTHYKDFKNVCKTSVYAAPELIKITLKNASNKPVEIVASSGTVGLKQRATVAPQADINFQASPDAWFEIRMPNTAPTTVFKSFGAVAQTSVNIMIMGINKWQATAEVVGITQYPVSLLNLALQKITIKAVDNIKFLKAGDVLGSTEEKRIQVAPDSSFAVELFGQEQRIRFSSDQETMDVGKITFINDKENPIKIEKINASIGKTIRKQR